MVGALPTVGEHEANLFVKFWITNRQIGYKFRRIETIFESVVSRLSLQAGIGYIAGKHKTSVKRVLNTCTGAIVVGDGLGVGPHPVTVLPGLIGKVICD